MKAQKEFIAYYRVSTKHQGNDGLGMEAQQTYVRAFAEREKGVIISEFHDVESGKNNNRRGLLAAIAESKRTGATLLVSKLCRLARKASFIMALSDAKVPFIACDMPNADHMILGFMAVVAQNTAETISDNTSRAMQAKKLRGEPVGNMSNLNVLVDPASLMRYRNCPATGVFQVKLKAGGEWEAATAKQIDFYEKTKWRIGKGNVMGGIAMQEAARQDPNNARAAAFAKRLRESRMTFAQIADELNKGKFQTPRGCMFTPMAVKRVLELMA